MTTTARHQPLDRTSTEYLERCVALYSNETLRELAKRRDGKGWHARRDLARRDHDATFGTAN